MTERFSRSEAIKLMLVGGASLAYLTGAHKPILEAIENERGDWLISANLEDYFEETIGIPVCVGERLSRGDRSIKNPTTGETTYLEFGEVKRGYRNATKLIEYTYSNVTAYPMQFIRNIRPAECYFLLGDGLWFEKNDTIEKYVQGVHWPTPDGKSIIASTTGSLRDGTLDHEIFHRAQHVLNNREATTAAFTEINSRHNLPPYSNVYEVSLETVTCELNIAKPDGSASCYGASQATEDAAEIARNLMSGDSKFYERAAREKALDEKRLAVIETFKAISDGQMNEDFFEMIAEGKKPNWGWPQIPEAVYNY